VASTSEVTLDAQNRLKSYGLCPESACLSYGTASVAEAGNDSIISWGRWTNGTAKLTVFGLAVPVTLNQNQGMHYLVGTPVVSVPTTGIFSYDLLAATKPTDRSGNVAPGTFTGQAVVQFGPGQAAKVGLSAQVSINGNNFGINTNGGVTQPQHSQVQLNSSYSFSADLNNGLTGASCQNGSQCSVNISGGLFGAQGQRLGLSYTLNPGSTQSRIDGVAVFKR
jgi:hypothetical protein